MTSIYDVFENFKNFVNGTSIYDAKIARRRRKNWDSVIENIDFLMNKTLYFAPKPTKIAPAAHQMHPIHL